LTMAIKGCRLVTWFKWYSTIYISLLCPCILGS
jgi:hypothetical protein